MFLIRGLTKTYNNKKNNVCALNNIDLDLPDKGLILVVGESGSGKTTLLNIFGKLENYESGEIYRIDEKGNETRDYTSSFVFQNYNLIDDFSVYDNLGFLASNSEIMEYVENFGLDNTIYDRKINSLSGGQQQRIAIVRALLLRREIILLDEPTGNLDRKNAEIIYELLERVSRNSLVVVVTHELEISRKYADKIIKIKNGQVSKITDMNKNYLNLRLNDSDSLIIAYEWLKKNRKKASKVHYKISNKPLQCLEAVENTVLFRKLNDIFSDFLEERVEFFIEEVSLGANVINHSKKKMNFSIIYQFKYAGNIVKNSFLRFVFINLILELLPRNCMS